MKAILVIDMPNNCSECKLMSLYGIGESICNPVDWERRPSWCPLKPIPSEACERLVKGLDAMEKMKSVKARVVRETPHFEGVDE